jgi:type VI secretion system secreted protein Hcp
MLAVKEVPMTKQISQVPTRRTILAGALGAGALGSLALSSAPATAALGDPTVPSEPELRFFLQLSTISGASTYDGFEGQIPLITWAWGVDSTASPVSGGGGGAGRATPRDVALLADTDIQSPLLLATTNTGRRLATALLSCVRPGEQPYTFMTLRFDEVVVTSYAVTPDPTYGIPTDLFHLRFARVTDQLFPQNPDGSAGSPITSTFDYRNNRGA